MSVVVHESKTPEIDDHLTAFPMVSDNDVANLSAVRSFIALARSLERRLAEYQAKHTAIMQEADRRYDELVTALSLAQTEIKGHMRVEDELKLRIAELEKELRELKSVAS